MHNMNLFSFGSLKFHYKKDKLTVQYNKGKGIQIKWSKASWNIACEINSEIDAKRLDYNFSKSRFECEGFSALKMTVTYVGDNDIIWTAESLEAEFVWWCIVIG